ncbi:hypothetical protein B0F90DRAFT_1736439 [Multifurca ochricompacta]|uniref:Uncharacterized protein n=1 Tax=Multifurca ochricompacta TaxID=376703 RepID=A0AAD4M118_9AGAM|nr:hypothetical protein B0F90DRAFT_1736439 [Multifurca ochricompacta]
MARDPEFLIMEIPPDRKELDCDVGPRDHTISQPQWYLPCRARYKQFHTTIAFQFPIIPKTNSDAFLYSLIPCWSPETFGRVRSLSIYVSSSKSSYSSLRDKQASTRREDHAGNTEIGSAAPRRYGAAHLYKTRQDKTQDNARAAPRHLHSGLRNTIEIDNHIFFSDVPAGPGAGELSIASLAGLHGLLCGAGSFPCCGYICLRRVFASHVASCGRWVIPSLVVAGRTTVDHDHDHRVFMTKVAREAAPRFFKSDSWIRRTTDHSTLPASCGQGGG